MNITITLIFGLLSKIDRRIFLQVGFSETEDHRSEIILITQLKRFHILAISRFSPVVPQGNWGTR
jgi:hypothetical protein